MGRKNKPTIVKERISDEMLEKLFIKGLILFFVVIAVYIPAMSGDYIYDDDQLLYVNPNITKGQGFDKESWKGLANFWLPLDSRGSADYFPATSTVLWLEWRLFGNDVPNTPPALHGIGRTGYHTVNILLHALCVILLWFVLERMAIPGAWFAALLWGIHPVNVESVAWISELKNTLSMALFLIMMLEWFKYQRTGQRWNYAMTLVFFVMSLLAKTAIIMVPFVMLLHIWWERGWKRVSTNLSDDLLELLHFSVALAIFAFWFMLGLGLYKWWDIYGLIAFAIPVTPILCFAFVAAYKKVTLPDLRESIPFFAISFVFGVVTWWFQITRAIGQEFVPIGGPFSRLASAGFALGFYFYKTVLPFNLLLIYPQWHNTVPRIVQILPGFAFLAVFVWAWLRRATWGRHVIYGLGFFVIMLFPILGFVKIAYMRLTLVADHFEYTAMVSLIALGVAAFLKFRSRLVSPVPEILNATMIGVMVIFGLLTMQRAYVFSDAERLWRDTLAKNPNEWQAHSHLGAILFMRGDLDGAYENWKRSVELKPYLYEVHNNLGLVLGAKGQLDKALEQYKIAVDIQPDQPAVRMNYADGLRIAKRYDEAIEQYQVLAKLNPEDPRPYLFTGAIQFNTGKLDDAITSFQQALKIAPNFGEAQHDLAMALQKKGVNPQNAMPPAQGEILSGSSTPEQLQQRMNYAESLRLSNHYDEAIAQYRDVLRALPNPNNPVVFFNMGVTYFSAGKLDEAIDYYQRALRLAPNYAEAQTSLQVALKEKEMKLKQGSPVSK